MEEYLVPAEEAESEFTEKRSRFIGHVWRVETEEEARVKSELLRISLVLATAKLSYAVAMAIKRGKPNGEIEDGIAQYNKSLERFREFEREQLVRNVDI